MVNTQVAELRLEIGLEGSDAEQLDHVTRQLLSEVRDLEIESAELVKGGDAPEGAKAIDPATLGAIALVALPAVLPKLIDFLQSWVMRQHGRSVKFKGKISDRDIEFEGSLKDLKTLLADTSAS
jgi:hypothetical protein